ncbi:MAG: hypothetical protein V8R43_04470 [Dorea sp.]|nr:hypothetical protein [uncultured Dorea sp.]
MIDITNYSSIYEEIKSLTPEDTLTLLLKAPTNEEKEFWRLIGDFLLQQEQKEVIRKNLF